ncbi:unnamed protein product [Strongylus vulgaris]|uniref:Uncharacterized protein n=1 Tax=Strongylus vulgaris TaxID=40348 RepID=A0A3P7J820_STRVU|nr:unnamed protein product [Strongylus vulgaris]
MDWSYNEEDRRQMDNKDSGMHPREVKRPRGRSPTRWVIVARMDQLNQLVTSNLANVAGAVQYQHRE